MPFWTDAKVLVTGAHGFTGSHLCRELVRQKATVTAFIKNGGILSNLGDLTRHITIVPGDITDITSLLAAMEGIDYVFNPAAIVPVLEARQAPQACLQVNTLGAHNVGYAAMKSGVKRMLHISTCHVYGNQLPENLPIKETAVPKPVDVYSASKYAAEICLRPLVDDGFHITFTRAFAMYGPGQREQYFIPRVISQLLKKITPVFGNSYPTRDYCYIEDTVRGYLLALQKGAPGEIYHFSSQREIAISDIYRLIAKLMDTVVEPVWNATPRRNEISRQVGDSSKARRELGWTPEVSLEKGLQLTIAWWRDHPEMWRTAEEDSLAWKRLHRQSG